MLCVCSCLVKLWVVAALCLFTATSPHSLHCQLAPSKTAVPFVAMRSPCYGRGQRSVRVHYCMLQRRDSVQCAALLLLLANAAAASCGSVLAHNVPQA
jgi:hypothetical protein